MLSFSVFDDSDTLGLSQPLFDVYEDAAGGHFDPDEILNVDGGNGGGGSLFQPVEPLPVPPPANPVTPVLVSAPSPAAWAVGRFHGSSNGLSIVLDISASGSVSANVNGSISTGRLSGTSLQMGSSQSTVSQISGGIRTSNAAQSIDYFSQPSSPPAPNSTPVISSPVGVVNSPPLGSQPAGVPPASSPAGNPSAGGPSIPPPAGGIEIDFNLLLIGGAVVAAILILK